MLFANKIIFTVCSHGLDLFERKVRCVFDTNQPLQLDETILTGSYSEGLFLFFGDPPDMDFMCVLKNITFTQKDQENGSLSFC